MEFLMRYINRTARLSELYRNEKLKEFGLSGIHHTYILNICRQPGLTQEELAEVIYVNKSNVTRQLAVLEKAGYVNRTPSKVDARKQLVFPTEKAQTVYPKVVEILTDWNAIVLEGLSEEEQKALGLTLKHMMEKGKAVVDQL